MGIRGNAVREGRRVNSASLDVGGASPDLREVVPQVGHIFLAGLVLRFNIDANGHAVNAEIASANPPGSGPAALPAMAVKTYRRPDEPDANCMVRMGFSRFRNGGNGIVLMTR